MTATNLAEMVHDPRQEELLREVLKEIELIEDELNLHVKSSIATAAAVGRHTLRAGGKRLRPAFVTIGAKATALDFDRTRTRRVGASMEMIHMATLIHDDVIDNSSTRRGLPTAAALYGNRASILGGDALLAKATVLLTQDGDVELIRAVSEAVVQMAEGEIRELELRGNINVDLDTHLEILALKTASFIEACCEAGAIVAGADAPVRTALRHYGRSLGLAFQIIDDVLDYRGDRTKTGKPCAIDFREGQATLPLVYLRETLTPTEEKLVQNAFGQESDEQIRTITAWMHERGIFKRCEQLAANYADQALKAADALPESESRGVLRTVADFVLSRQL
jgi:geranylgeranyl pyrophosphate synthase